MTAAKKLVDMRFLRTLVPLGELSDVQLRQLMGSYSVELLASGTTLFSQGDNDPYTYYLLSGQLHLSFLSGAEKSVRSQTSQSRYMLAPERPRCATATTTSTATVLKVDKDVLDRIVGFREQPGLEVNELATGNQNDWMTLYLQSKVFLKLRAQNIQALMMRLEEIPVKAGQIIIRQNDDDGYYYIIKQGHCKVTRRNSPYEDEVEQAQLTIGTGFGEEAIISQNRRGATVTMLDDGCLMRLSRSDFNRILVEPLIKDALYEDALKMENFVFLDVRHYDDYIKDGLKGGINITLFELRVHIDSLDKDKTYILYSNHGHRASAAAYLLCQQGLEGIILRGGLDGVPVDAARGNHPEVDENNIPVVDNVIRFDSAKQVVSTPRGLAQQKITIAPAKKTNPETAPSRQEAMQDPRVLALLQQASSNVQHGQEQELLADVARQKAEHEVIRLKMEAKLAARSAEQARRKAEQYAQASAEKASQSARDEAARLRELELGAKQAEMEEAVRQAAEEAKRAQDAEIARVKAEQENIALKEKLESAISQVRDEANRSTESIRQFAEQEEEKQRESDRKQQQHIFAREKAAEEARITAQLEICALRNQVESTRLKMQQEADDEAEKVRQEAKSHAEQLAEQELEKMRTELEEVKQQGKRKISEILLMEEEKRQFVEQQVYLAAQEEMQGFATKAQEQAKRAALAEQANERAAAEILQIKKDMELVRREQNEAAIVAAEQARSQAIQEANAQSEKALLEKEQEIAEAIEYADQCSLRAKAAEATRDQAVVLTQGLQTEVAVTQQEIQVELSQDIARSEIEHEVARARAVELANKQAEIEEIRLHAEEVASRAKEAEDAKHTAEQEVENLKAEVDRFRNEHQPKTNESSHSDSAQQIQHQKEIEQKQVEIELATHNASEEGERAKMAEVAHQHAQQEIERLKTEVEIATLQAKAQLASDKERSEVQQLEVNAKTVALAEKQNQVIAAIDRAKVEKGRAKEADVARIEAEQTLERYREDAEHHEKIKIEISNVRADAISKQLAMEAAAKRARKEAARAESAEKARGAAEQEIVRLKKIALRQQQKAEQAIRKSLEVVNKTAKETMKSSQNKGAKDKQTPETPESAWVSDHVLWETTLGLRNDKAVEDLVNPESVSVPDQEPWAETLLTKIAIPESYGPDSEFASIEYEDERADRPRFKTSEINHGVTAQIDARNFIKKNHAVKKPVVLIVSVLVAFMVGGIYYSLDGTQRAQVTGPIQNLIEGKQNILAPTKQPTIKKKQAKEVQKKIEPPVEAETMEQRVERNQIKARLAQDRRRAREDRKARQMEQRRTQPKPIRQPLPPLEDTQLQDSFGTQSDSEFQSPGSQNGVRTVDEGKQLDQILGVPETEVLELVIPNNGQQPTSSDDMIEQVPDRFDGSDLLLDGPVENKTDTGIKGARAGEGQVSPPAKQRVVMVLRPGSSRTVAKNNSASLIKTSKATGNSEAIKPVSTTGENIQQDLDDVF
ncbi:MAG: cyclic nucleotide-binding domain-containing protein [Thiohalomonadales bacterium]